MTAPRSFSALPGPLTHALEWCLNGSNAAVATVTGTWGSAPRPAGSFMAISSDGRVEGSVSGGCVEADVIQAASSLMQSGTGTTRLNYGISNGMAWETGLACGGKLEVLVEAVKTPSCPHGTLPFSILERILTMQERRQRGILIRSYDGSEHILSDATLQTCPDILRETAAQILLDEKAQTTERYFLQPITPPPRLLIVGAVHIAQILAPMARLTGFETIIIDPRSSLATPERFPGETLMTEWPDEAMEHCGLDDSTAVVTLTHDLRFDDPALIAALKSPAFYVGALGSRTTQGSRLLRLQESGITPENLQRLRGPVGLAIGGIGAEEIALSIMADLVAVRRHAPLAEKPGWTTSS